MALVLSVRDGEMLEVGDLGTIAVRIHTGPRGGRRVQLVIEGAGLRPVRLADAGSAAASTLEKPDGEGYKR